MASNKGASKAPTSCRHGFISALVQPSSYTAATETSQQQNNLRIDLQVTNRC